MAEIQQPDTDLISLQYNLIETSLPFWRCHLHNVMASKINLGVFII